MDKDTLKLIKERVANLPLTPGVYIMRDNLGKIIYIGKAKVLKNRVSQYFINTKKPEKVQKMVENVKTFDYIITNTELEALNLESNLIKKHQPFYNILLKDGKAHPFLKINLKDDFPKFEITRKIKTDGAKYFGPYFGAINIKDLLTLITIIFNLRTCSLNINENKLLNRECLNYHLGLCKAPCTGKIGKQEYNIQVHKAMQFLKGNYGEAKQNLINKMQNCANNENFEKAIEYRNYINIIDNLKSELLTELKTNIDIDVFAFATNGTTSVISILIVRAGKILGLNNFNVININDDVNEIIGSFVTQYYPSNSPIPDEIILPCCLDDCIIKYLTDNNKVKLTCPKKGVKKKLLNLANENAKDYLEKNIEKTKMEELKTIGATNLLKTYLELENSPKRIEGYDISNTFGTNKVASMVVFENGKPKYSNYRKFKIKTVEGINDFACMYEVVTRRLDELKNDDVSFKQTPDLILIDGGMGQLGYATKALKEHNLKIPIISLAEREEEIFIPNKTGSLKLNKDDYGLKLLQKVRDEAHRYAITFHKNLRQKSSLASELLKIPLVGKEKEIKLFNYFKDINKIKNASIEELMKVDGISTKIANNIYSYFHK